MSHIELYNPVIDECPVPPITDPMGRGWEQPDRLKMVFDSKTVIMSREDFNKLYEYSTSNPTGCYLGKMWKRQNYNIIKGDDDEDVIKWLHTWKLCWFDLSSKGDKWCSTETREIIILD